MKDNIELPTSSQECVELKTGMLQVITPLAAAKAGTPSFSPNILQSGWWSVTKTNFRPYRYWWKRFTANIMLSASRHNSVLLPADF